MNSTVIRFLLFAAALILAALSSLTVQATHSHSLWKLAVLAGEFGHLLWLAALVVLLGVGGIVRTETTAVQRTLKIATVGLCLLAIGFFLKPTFQALSLAKTLPQDLEKAFGPFPPVRPAFSVSSLISFGKSSLRPSIKVFAREGTNEALQLDFYTASKPTAPCVIVIHGGGWDSGERGQFSRFSAELAQHGYAVADLDYRLAPHHRWPAQRDDVRAAIEYLKSNHAVLGLDPQRLVLLGRSAGGQIAEAVAYGQADPAIRGVIALYAPADLYFAWDTAQPDDPLDTHLLLTQYLGGSPQQFPKPYENASPYQHVGKAAPPTLVIHGRLDTLVRPAQSARLVQQLAKAKRPAFFLELPWATHAFDFNAAGPGGQISSYAIEWFLAAVTR